MHPNDNLDSWHSGQGHWKSVSNSNWNDWRWQLQNRLGKKEHMEEFISISDDESAGLGIAKDKCENIWSEADLSWIANYVWNDYWSKY